MPQVLGSDSKRKLWGKVVFAMIPKQTLQKNTVLSLEDVEVLDMFSGKGKLLAGFRLAPRTLQEHSRNMR